MSEFPDDSFKVCWSEKNREAVKELARKASQVGLSVPFLESLKHIQEKLSSEPLTWGDPTHRLRHAGWQMYHGIYELLHIYYAVDEPRGLVFIKEIDAMPNRGLD